MGTYKRKRESKKTRKHAFDQESGQEKMKKLSFFLDRFLGRELVFLLFSYFLVFFFKFPPGNAEPDCRCAGILSNKTIISIIYHNCHIDIVVKSFVFLISNVFTKQKQQTILITTTSAAEAGAAAEIRTLEAAAVRATE